MCALLPTATIKMMARYCLIALSVLAAACGSGSGDSKTDAGNDSGSGAQLVVMPETDQVITVASGQTTPTIEYTATLDGMPVDVTWQVNRGEVGTVAGGPSAGTVFTPTGQAGGVVLLYASSGNHVVERRIMVQLQATQNGPSTSPAEQAQVPTSVGDLSAGGGVGGVGGEGLGPAVTDAPTLAALDAPTSDGTAQGLTLLYPYDDTVWPRGMLAPLLQWGWSIGDADAVKIELATASGSYSYAGTFARPAILSQTGGSFIRHPIAQDAWTQATDTAGGTTLTGDPDTLTVKLTIAKDGVGYGPIEQTYRVAPARLAGTIYYQSYGTNLAKNYTGAVGGDGSFGGAVLSIKVGDTGPALTSGSSGSAANCRVCHSVAADGSRLVAQSQSITYGVTITPSMVTEASLATNTDFPGMTPDGAFALTRSGELLDLANGGATVATTGLSDVSTNLGTPAFAPSGTKVAFNPMSGDGVAHPKQSLMVMDYDPATHAFSNPIEILDTSGGAAQTRPGWPAYMPTNDAVIYQQQIAAGGDGNNRADLRTRKGAKAYLAWTHTNGAGVATPLDLANGVGHAPQLASPVSLTCTGDGDQVGGIDADHADDVNLNYEPTVNPVASGGYAWVVFTSRRLYGNVATIPPFCSDPRGVDLIENLTTKKLWVTAIDLNAPAGTDPSHPAFYLPAQEILAGNARGFWVLDPCRTDGTSCETGDQCCNGFCSTKTDEFGLVCSSEPESECSMTQEACTTAADCCNPTDECINNFCAQIIVE